MFLWVAHMMCLGWSTQPSCTTREPVQVTPDCPDKCPSITWFWVGLAVVLVGGAINK